MGAEADTAGMLGPLPVAARASSKSIILVVDVWLHAPNKITKHALRSPRTVLLYRCGNIVTT